mgnify:CR=1 FL=1
MTIGEGGGPPGRFEVEDFARRGTVMKNCDAIPDLVGWEWHGRLPGVSRAGFHGGRLYAKVIAGLPPSCR